MFKFFVLSAILAVALCQDGSSPVPQLIPMLSNLCNNGCPTICQAMSIFCIDVPVGPSCADAKTKCDDACTQTCACVDKCGEDCDEFETNCQNLGIPLIAGVFCPTQGGFCDASCVATCPQRTMLTLVQGMANRIGTNVQGMIALILSQLPLPGAGGAK